MIGVFLTFFVILQGVYIFGSANRSLAGATFNYRIDARNAKADDVLQQKYFRHRCKERPPLKLGQPQLDTLQPRPFRLHGGLTPPTSHRSRRKREKRS